MGEIAENRMKECKSGAIATHKDFVRQVIIDYQKISADYMFEDILRKTPLLPREEQIQFEREMKDHYSNG